jgi:hypothetical protein
MVVVVDFVLLLLCITTDVLAFLVALHYSSDWAYIFLGFTSVYSLLCILQHCPYIILAYINDVELTGSIFIFYTVSWGSMFLVIAVFYTNYHKSVLPCHMKVALFFHRMIVHHNPRQNPAADLESSTSSLSSQSSEVNRHRKLSYQNLDPEVVQPTCRKLFCESFVFIIYCILICILALGAVALLSCYLVILPITNGLSHLFGRLVSTYQTALLIIGAIVTYKAFFENKSKLQSADLEADNNDVPEGSGHGSRSKRNGGLPVSVTSV